MILIRRLVSALALGACMVPIARAQELKDASDSAALADAGRVAQDAGSRGDEAPGGEQPPAAAAFAAPNGQLEPPGSAAPDQHAEVVSALGTAPATGPTSSDPAPLLVTVRSKRADELRRSSQAVTVVEVERARRGSADLGEVLARTEGISIQRAGGLGSESRFSLAGLDGERIRFFVDSIPLENAGFAPGVENVPLNLLERIEVYRGVVPIRLASDALGGAVQLISRRPMRGTHGHASYQAGSFDTHRLTLQASHFDEPTGRYALVSSFLDRSRNDFAIDVQVPDASGRPSETRVHHFHAAYEAQGAMVEVGLLDRPWAERLSLRAFASQRGREIPTDIVMTEPYGAATEANRTTGASLVYKRSFLEEASFELIANYAYHQASVRDLSQCAYDWFGRCTTLPRSGELMDDFEAGEAYLYAHALSLRASASVPIDELQQVSISIAPQFDQRTGEDRSPEYPDTRDPLDVTNRIFNLFSGASYELRGLGERLDFELFGKQYTQVVRGELSVPLGIQEQERERYRFGAGSMARLRWLDPLWSKLSYEYATRYPSTNEMFGNGTDVLPNPYLRAELSHNANLESAFELEHTRSGSYLLDVAAFYRRATDFIARAASGTFGAYINVSDVRVLGAQGRARWISPGEYFTLDGNLTYQHVRNDSKTGIYADFRGDRVPNRPYLFGTVSARAALPEVMVPRDQLSLAFVTRCTGKFDRSWRSIGSNHPGVPRQVQHSIALTYLVRGKARRNLSATLELQNLTDAKLTDFFGVQRPGRAVFAKLVVEL